MLVNFSFLGKGLSLGLNLLEYENPFLFPDFFVRNDDFFQHPLIRTIGF